MSCCDLHTHARGRAKRFDPTRTLTLRMKYERDMVRRFKLLKKDIAELMSEDGLGIQTNAPRFDFQRNPDKINSFMRWLRGRQDKHILETKRGVTIGTSAERAWQDVYITSAYQKGLADAASNLSGQGVSVNPDYITSAFFRPTHADRAGIIFTRAFTDLKGITEAMDAKISRVLSQGIIEGRGVRSIARDLADTVDSIGITRARVLARTEVINAHAEASLNTYREAGVQGVLVQAEFTTAQDDAVCEECEALAGTRVPIDEASGIIPVHPNCRCAWLPVVDDPSGLGLN
jgi:SPP1 gp7 family putative phage head morphogenesis protein